MNTNENEDTSKDPEWKWDDLEWESSCPNDMAHADLLVLFLYL